MCKAGTKMARKKMVDEKKVRKRAKKIKKSAKTVETFDFRRHISLLGRLQIERPTNAKQHIKKVRQFVEQRKHSDFLQVVGEVLTPKYLYYSQIDNKEFDRLVLFLWRYCLLGKNTTLTRIEC